MNRFAKLTTALAAACLLAGCGTATEQKPASASAPEQSGRIPVAVSFNAMKELTQAVGGDKVQISVVIPDGVEPHDFEPKGQDMKKLSEAKLFVYNGMGMESWVDKAAKAANNQNLVSLEVSKGVEPIKNTDPEEIEEHGQYDPHVWISPKSAEKEAAHIRDALIKISPENKDYFEQNYNVFKGKLDKINDAYDHKFRSVQNKTIVTGHAAFAYLCRDFGLEQKSVEDVFASGEPTPQKLAELTDFCKANHIKTVFTEELVSPDVSKTLANEAGAEAKTIYTMESSEGGKTYLERMESNLEEIYNSLK